MTVLVTGATGTVGRNVVEQLIGRGRRVRALTRNPERANLPAGVEVVAGDLTAPETLAPALEGVSALHLINFGGAAYADYAPLQSGPEIVELARKAGVKRVTVLLGGEKGPVEQAVEASGLAWTFLQPVEFMSNALEWADSIRAEGVVREPFVNRLSAMVHPADIGAVAATALSEDGHGGQTYTLTGPEALTLRQKMDTIGAAIGRQVRLIELTEEQARARWRAAGYPEEDIEFLVWMFGNTPEVGYTVVPTVEAVTGRPPRSFAQWVAEHAESFRS